MAKTNRQTALFGTEDWKTLYKTYKEADFQSYNFETLRKTFVDYLEQHHPESFNDFTESSEFIAILDVMAFMGQSLSFRNDLNARENFLDTAERRDSVTRLAKLVGYSAKRNENAKGFLQVQSINTTETLIDYNQNNLNGKTIRWNDTTNPDWQEQFTIVMNAALVNSQKIGNPGHSANLIGIKTDEYEINMADGFLPVIPFGATIDGVGMDFELVNATSQNKTYIYEPAPQESGALNILYRNDNLGFAGANTGYFFHFKQGLLESQDFELTDQIQNRTFDVNINGVNNNDVWLFKILTEGNEHWIPVENIYSSQDDQSKSEDRKFYSIQSRVNDQITFNFGDGVFSNIPLGLFRTYARSSNGLEYVINSNEIQGVEVAINYVSKTGRNETITFSLSLTEPVSNAKNKENLPDIKRRAPARYYTQNRMVNGEDYNNFAYTAFSSIIKSKAVNRTNIGASRYLDLIDPTGKYSSINTFGHDGVLYKDTNDRTFGFTFNDKNDIQSVIQNQVEPLIADRQTIQFYYEEFNRISLTSTDIIWNQSSTFTNQTTGYFKDSNETPIQIAGYSEDETQFIVENALMKFVPITGYHFTGNNQMVPGIPTKPDDKMEIWVSIQHILLDGTNFGNGNLDDGTGPVIVNNFIPTGAIPIEIIGPFNTDLPVATEQAMLPEIELFRNFGLGYEPNTGEWYLIMHDNIDLDSDFSLAHAGSELNQNDDASWMIKFVANSGGYIVTSRSLSYYFASVLETRFFHDNNRKIYDTRTSKVVNDYINILKTNSKPDSHEALNSDIRMDIIDQSVEPDGYVNDFNVEISFTDTDHDGIADNPDFFSEIVNDDLNSVHKFVYFESTVDFDNLERFLPLATGVVNDEYGTKDQIELVKTEYAAGTLFYAYTDRLFYILNVDAVSRTLALRTDLISKVGRPDMQFQYRHNSPETRRINPGVSNIIDIFVVTNSYFEAFTNYMQDTTDTVQEPKIPTTDELTTEYDKLQEHRMVSDNIVLNSVRFKPLFGSKADSSLQAFIKVVKVQNTVSSDSDIKSKVITAINEYFDINIWDFGDIFYFSELSAYLHSKLGDTIGSAIIVSKNPEKSFGDLYEIRSEPNEIFISSATVDDVEIIDALTASNVQIGA